MQTHTQSILTLPQYPDNFVLVDRKEDGRTFGRPLMRRDRRCVEGSFFCLFRQLGIVIRQITVSKVIELNLLSLPTTEYVRSSIRVRLGRGPM